MLSDKNYFAERIKTLRKTMGLTQQEMADVIGVRKTTICNYESGYSTPTTKTINKIRTLFRLPNTYFLSENEVDQRFHQNLFGITIPFYDCKNITGLLSKDKMLMDSPLTLPAKISLTKTQSIATLVPDNSMNMCGIKKGNCVVINTSASPSDGKIIAAIQNGELIIRKYHNNSSGTYMTAESNKIPAGMSFEEIPTENFTFLGIVTINISDI